MDCFGIEGLTGLGMPLCDCGVRIINIGRLFLLVLHAMVMLRVLKATCQVV